MRNYLDALEYVYNHGKTRVDRTGVGTKSIFGFQMRFDLSKGFPSVTTKKLAFKSVVSELLWFLEGSTDERRLAEIHYGKPASELVGKTTIWTANADKQGVDLGYTNTDIVKDLGPVYGAQWRLWMSYGSRDDSDSWYTLVDQIEELIEGIKNDPYSRRHILTAWNPGEINHMALPPCHCFAQFYVDENKLSCQIYQRSVDAFLGLPFNIASYALLTHMIAQVCGLEVGELVHTSGDIHIYLNHLDQVAEQLERTPFNLPRLSLDKSVMCIDDFKMESITLDGYQSHSAIKGDMAV